jgi:hypothetical protein
VTRRAIVDLGNEAYHVEEKEDGSVALLRTTTVDDGPARSVTIHRDALTAVAAELWAIPVRRTLERARSIVSRAKGLGLGRDQ